ncbi:MAG: restriction endonuclease subunit S [Candidatus Dadabacteria bacterium]|nr:restriction endonuclease subunit S [Candidatus Dadabacteria bacterium]
MSLQISSKVDKNKVFLVWQSELRGRLDSASYSVKNIFTGSLFPLQRLKTHFIINPQQKEKTVPFDTYAFIPMENVSEEDASIAKIGTIQGSDSRGYTTFLERDLICAKITPCMENGKMAIVKDLPSQIGFGSTEFHVFREKTHKVSVEFLRSLFLLRSFRDYAKCNFTGSAGQQRVPTEFFDKLEIPIPPPKIQSKIVTQIDAAYEAKKKKESEAQQLLDSIESYLLSELGIRPPKQEENSLVNRMFTRHFREMSGGRLDPFYYKNTFEEAKKSLEKGRYPLMLLKDLASLIESGSRPSGGVATLTDGVLSFGGEHINNQCEIEVKTPKYIPYDFHKANLSTETKENDVLLVKDGATTGKIGIVENQEHVGQNINEHVFLLRFAHSMNPYYFLNLATTHLYQILIQRVIAGATVMGLTKDIVKAFQIPLPPIDKQNEIADNISGIRNQVRTLQEQAKEEVEQAKKEVEVMILRDSQ